MKKILLVVATPVVLVGGYFGYHKGSEYVQRQSAIAEQENVVLPPVRQASSRSSVSTVASSIGGVVPSVAPSVPSGGIAAELNIPVQFIPQAPLGEWDPDHKEACEEASALAVMNYFRGHTYASLQEIDADLIALVRRNEEMGFDIDQTADQVRLLMLDRMPSLDITIVKDPTVDDLKRELTDGAVIIVPAAGQLLRNPYFQNPGPPYHMLVLRGFTKDGYAITNDPGTKRGEAFVYKWDVLMNAMHDWTGAKETIEAGQKVVLVVKHPAP